MSRRARPAKFTIESIPNERRPTHSIKVHKCWCGWETRKTNSSLYGRDGDLDFALLAHRLDHLEGRIDT